MTHVTSHHAKEHSLASHHCRDHHHHHHHHSGHHHHHTSTGNLKMAFWLNLLFAIFEFVGGFFASSVAILSDAVHDLGDALSLGVAWYLQRLSSKGRDRSFSYGYKRFSLLGALFISVVLAVGSILMIIHAIEKMKNPVQPHSPIMLVMACAGLAVNGFAALRMSRGKTLNEKTVMYHLLEDVLGWLAVLVVSVVMLFAEIPILDPLLSIAISLWILWNVVANLRQTFKIFLQAVPEELDSTRLQQEIGEVEGVSSMHDFHLWTLDGEKHILSLHVSLKSDAYCQAEQSVRIKEDIRRVAHGHDIDHVTIEIDPPHYSCGMEDC